MNQQCYCTKCSLNTNIISIKSANNNKIDKQCIKTKNIIKRKNKNSLRGLTIMIFAFWGCILGIYNIS